MHIGVDAGSKFIKIVRSNDGGIITPYVYCQHNGSPDKEILRLVNGGLSDAGKIIFSGAHAHQLARNYDNAEIADEISATIEAINYLNNKCRYIVNVGAGSIKLIELDNNGDFSSYSENSLCAAGTGSFLDEQMHRMNFSYNDIESMSYIKDAPDIATRCAVFAKSDLIHRQQEGYTKEEMWSGLCRGVTTTMLQSVFRGDVPDDDILFCGGLFLNPIVRLCLKETVKSPFFYENGHFLSAIGSVILNGKNKKAGNSSFFTDEKQIKKNNLKILELKYSKSADFSTKHEYFSNELEVRIHDEPKNNSRVSLGIDIGSTSTKLVVLDAGTRDVLIDIYGRTKGNPIDATKKLFGELKQITGNRNIKIISAATTGSGRKLVGKIIGADLIINEITAHFKGASFFTPFIETIFEIGGQDSKYIRGHNGNVVDCNMNFVCAAGTGSFIEEQAQRLGFDVRDIGDLVLGLKTPHTSDRCTVFMEQDINKLLSQGFSREDVLAGVISSIAKNYLSRVVGLRPVTGEKIFFQGATARNKGLVAAFESLLNKEIVVSPFCHVMGSLGAAILSLERTSLSESRFRGLDVLNQHIELEYTKCGKCANLCKITTAKFFNGTQESWGFMCGKETFNEEKKGRSIDHFKELSSLVNSGNRKVLVLRELKKPERIGIPFTLVMHNYLPLWKTFLEELGFDVVLSGASTLELKEKAMRISKSDFCFPVKLSLAHFQDFDDHDNVEYFFYPAMLSEKTQDNGMPRVFCPYVVGFPSVAKETLSIEKEIISPLIDFRQKKSIIINNLFESLRGFDFSKHEISAAYNAGIKRQQDYFKERYDYGQSLLKEINDNNKTGVVCIGRPYNLYDKIVNLGLPERLKESGVLVFPFECLIDPEENDPDIEYMYWNYGEKILNAAKKIKDIDNVYPVYFTNFSCGPDSFILSRFEEIMRGKPYLIIEFDEHESETGYLTRIEAFTDVILEKERKNPVADNADKLFHKSWRHKNKKLWFPAMYDLVPRFFAASFRGYGFNAEALPTENTEVFELGRQNTRGSECLPASTTIGAFLRKMKEIDADPSEHALFMPTAEGPCRFGQYSILHKRILEKNGMGEAEIFSPTSTNSYLGIDSALVRYLLDASMVSDAISKFVHKTRPYEINKGETDRRAEEIAVKLESFIEKKSNLLVALESSLEVLSAIPVEKTIRPLAGIVGEQYVRANSFCNNNVIRYVEEHGGEAWLTPFSEWLSYTAWMERYLVNVNRKNIFLRLGLNLKVGYILRRIHEFELIMKKYIPDRIEPPIEKVLEEGKKYVPVEFEGETILTIGRAILFMEQGADLIVNCAPFGCMPGNMTTSIFHNIQKKYNIPIMNLFYDGESDVNRSIAVYLNNIKKEDPDVVAGKSNTQQLSLTNMDI